MFKKICYIKARRENGRIITNTPQELYNNQKKLSLHAYGKGAFCFFRIKKNLNLCGVYKILINKEIKYIGECKNLSKRFNMGYGQISPRNCYVGGQQTNCRINKMILKEAKKGKTIELRFNKTDNYKVEEKRLIEQYNPEWNKK